MTQSAAEIAAMLGLAEDDPIVVEHIEAHEIEVREQRARDRVARTLGDHLQAGPKDPFANREAGYAPRGDAAASTLAVNERETDPRRLSQRRKEIAYGKNTLGYERYLAQVPKHKRGARYSEHPRTPDSTKKVSKRAFDGTVKAWRRALHEWDPPKDERGAALVAPTPAAAAPPPPPAAAPPAAAAVPDDDFGPDVFAVLDAAEPAPPMAAAAAPESAAANAAVDHGDLSDDDLL